VRHALLLALLSIGLIATSSASLQQPTGKRIDVFWCPMHPDIRSPDPGTCPLCSMELVRIPAATRGAYELDVTQTPRAGGNGTTLLRLQIRHPDTSKAVSAFAEIHERILHLFIIGRDLSFFAHAHPEQIDDGFELPVNLEPGPYVLVADFVPSSGAPQLVQRAIVAPGSDASPFASPDVRPDLAEKVVDDVRISLTADAIAQRASVLRFTVRDLVSNAGLTDLEPYLGAGGHLLIVNPDITVAIHAHPDGRPTSGPDIVFSPLFPNRGLYKLWVQFQRRGSVITAPFAVAVR
jgi:hypothetical protein